MNQQYSVEYINHPQFGPKMAEDSPGWQDFWRYLKITNKLFGEGETVTPGQFRRMVKKGATPAMQRDGALEQGVLLLRNAATNTLIGYASIEFYTNPDKKSSNPAIAYVDYTVIGTMDGSGNLDRNNPGAFRFLAQHAKQKAWAYGEDVLKSRGQAVTDKHDVPVVGEAEDPRLMTYGDWAESMGKHVDPSTRYIAYGARQGLNARTINAPWLQQIENDDGTPGPVVDNLVLMVASARFGTPVKRVPSDLLRHWMHRMYAVSLTEGGNWAKNPVYAGLDQAWAQQKYLSTRNDYKSVLAFKFKMRKAHEQICNVNNTVTGSQIIKLVSRWFDKASTTFARALDKGLKTPTGVRHAAPAPSGLTKA